MAQRTRPRTTSRSIIMDSLMERGLTRGEATLALSVAASFRGAGTPAQRKQAVTDYINLSSSAASAACDIMERWDEVASSRERVADLSERQARQIASSVRTPTPLTEFYGRGFRNMLQFLHMYVVEGMSFEESARRIGEATPRRTRR